MAGWIKLSRDISEHWIWQDEFRAKWWMDLLLMASWEDKKVMHDTHVFTLKKGQIIASVSFLSKKWNRSAPTIIKFLKLLEDDNMITRETLYRQTSIITICNYANYQGQDNTTVDTIVNTIVDTKPDTIVNTIVDTNKEIKEIKNNNYNNNNAREENSEIKESAKPEDLSDEEFFNEMRTDQLWRETMCMTNRIKMPQLDEYLEKFKLECQCKSTTHMNRAHCRQHFFDWLRIQLNYQAKQDKLEKKKLTEQMPVGMRGDVSSKKFEKW